MLIFVKGKKSLNNGLIKVANRHEENSRKSTINISPTKPKPLLGRKQRIQDNSKPMYKRLQGLFIPEIKKNLRSKITSGKF